ncbi:MAG: Na+/H+ antiporter subunit E [Tepidimonas sp.]|uniref:Na+/H+ antiporter subunit E n=1 Tax=Tepidimonas sp. TaxID=2002775 RepID=UPI00298EEFB4|nr:Na+/H+ antiporter subunit E [Tepidimonas sp.]MDW8336774.1 Na+/H+ antiporter subunit E [Tepidimonas sp.]
MNAPVTPPNPHHAACRWRRLWPHPVLSLLLAAAWLVLVRSVEPVHLLGAALLAWAVPYGLTPWLPEASRLDWRAALRLMGVVLWDIVVANVTVARLTLGPMGRLQPAWVRVPLACDHPRVRALLASIITMTPGTVSAVVDERRGCIWVHVLNCADGAALVEQIKARYEAALLRVFCIDRPTDRALQE